jgi:antitoxin PrlF
MVFANVTRPNDHLTKHSSNVRMHRIFRSAPMPAILEVATLTSKGQITLPKPIRQALGVDVGGQVAFEF